MPNYYLFCHSPQSKIPKGDESFELFSEYLSKFRAHLIIIQLSVWNYFFYEHFEYYVCKKKEISNQIGK